MSHPESERERGTDTSSNAPVPIADEAQKSLVTTPSRVRGLIENNAVAVASVAAFVSIAYPALQFILWILPNDQEAKQQAERIEQSAPYLSAELTGMPPRLRVHNHGLGTAKILNIIFTDNDGNLLLDASDLPETEDERAALKEKVAAIQAKFVRSNKLEELGLSGIPVSSTFAPGGQTTSIPVGGFNTLFEVLNVEQMDELASAKGQQQAFLEWASSFTQETEVQVGILYSGMEGGCYILEVGRSPISCDYTQ